MVSFILFLNRFLRRPRVGGRESEEAYSQWEHEWGCELVNLYMEPAGDVEGKTILDIGCGLGGKTVAYGEGGASQVLGADISLDNVKASHNFASKEERVFNWTFFVCDASMMPNKENVIDTVVANDAMEHFADPEGALAEMRRVLKSSGAVWIFFTPHFSPLGSHLYDYIYIPWCHLLFSRRSIMGTIRRVLEERKPGIPDDEISVELEEIMRSYDQDLNHMSIRRFFRILKRFPDLGITYSKLEPPKFRFLKLLTYIPLVRELFTGTVICRLEKTG